MNNHGMVLVSTGRMTVPTCLCGWVGTGELGATAIGNARRRWEGHVELAERIPDAVAWVVE